jgi:4-hydroxy-4-methyl-2-oxoglutarate aldolase
MTVLVHSPPAPTVATADFEAWRDIPVAVAVDLMRAVGQIDPAIRPLNPPGRQPRLFGRAVTVRCEPPDFGAVVRVLDIAGPGDVVMIAAAGNAEVAMIGEILGGHLRRRGCAGLVCDGAIRDVATLAGWPDFSVYTRFVTPRGPLSAERGEVNAPVVIGGHVATPGDLVLGDDDGLVVLSADAVRARIGDARARLALEDGWIRSLAEGRSALETFGLSAESRP